MHEAVILAGGFGTRLQTVVKDIPKSMAPVNGRPFLEYLLDYLISYNYKKIVLSVGYKSESIISHFGSSYKELEIIYAIENEPLGTGGGIRMALTKCDEKNVLALNGDTLFLVDLHNFNKLHHKKNAVISIALRKVADISRYGEIKVNRNRYITSFGEKTSAKVPGLINGGIYIIQREFFLENTNPSAFSAERDIFEKWTINHKLAGFAYDSYFLDIGIPADFLKAQHEFQKLKY